MRGVLTYSGTAVLSAVASPLVRWDSEKIGHLTEGSGAWCLSVWSHCEALGSGVVRGVLTYSGTAVLSEVASPLVRWDSEKIGHLTKGIGAWCLLVWSHCEALPSGVVRRD